MDGVEILPDVFDVGEVFECILANVAEWIAGLRCDIDTDHIPPGLVVADGCEACAGAYVEDAELHGVVWLVPSTDDNGLRISRLCGGMHRTGFGRASPPTPSPGERGGRRCVG